MKLLKSVAVLSFLFQLTAHAAWRIDTSGLKIAPPPARDSAADKKDFAILFDYQEKRTEEECRLAGLQSWMSVSAFFGPETGVLTDDEAARVEDFAGEVAKTIEKAVSPFKKRFERERPYDENGDIKPCIKKPGSSATSYPSSHAAVGWVLGDLLGEIYPSKAAALKAAGRQVGEYRVLGGVHHPTDVIAGRRLGSQIEDALRENDDFVKALDALKQ